MTRTLRSTLDDALDGRQLLSHPFYQRWEAGELSRDELTRYAEQYRHFEEMMPRFLGDLADALPSGDARTLVEANLRDEVATPSHLELFDRFAAHFDAQPAPASPAMSELLHAYDDVLAAGPVVALGGLLAYESQGAAVAESKGAGLARHYDASPAALEFWTQHGSLEHDHAAWTLAALEELAPSPSDVRDGARTVADAWWNFLDERERLAA